MIHIQNVKFTCLLLSGISVLGLGCVSVNTLFHRQEPEQYRKKLAQLTYPLELTASNMAPLENGYYQELAASDSASLVTVQLGKWIARGDLNHDQLDDFANILVATSGGSGTFYYLSAVLQGPDGNEWPIDTLYLGDRIRIDDISIKDQKIIVNYFDRRPGQPMAAEPTHRQRLIFILQNGELQPAISQ